VIILKTSDRKACLAASIGSVVRSYSSDLIRLTGRNRLYLGSTAIRMWGYNCNSRQGFARNNRDHEWQRQFMREQLRPPQRAKQSEPLRSAMMNKFESGALCPTD